MNVGIVRAVGMALFAIVLQHVVFDHVRVHNVHLDVLLVLSMCVGVIGGADRGAVAGFAAGLIADIFLPMPLGVSALSYALAGYLVGMLADDGRDPPWVVAMLAVLGSVVAILAFLAVGRVSGELTFTIGHAFGVVVVTGAVNGILAPLLAAIVRKALPLQRDRKVAW